MKNQKWNVPTMSMVRIKAESTKVKTEKWFSA